VLSAKHRNSLEYTLTSIGLRYVKLSRTEPAPIVKIVLVGVIQASIVLVVV